MKCNIRASYGIDQLEYFPNLNINNTKYTNTNNMNSDATQTSASISNEESTLAQPLVHDDFLQML